MGFFKKVGKFLGKVGPAAVGFSLGGPFGAMAGHGLGKMIGGGGGGGGGGIPPYNAGPNPANSAMPYLNQVAPIGRQYYQPFIGEGQQASGIANPIYNQMSQDPSAFIDSLMRNYTPSEGYRFKERELGRAAQNTAAQGGFLGTRTSQLELADLIRGLLGDDMQQYLGNVMGAQQRGLMGQEGRIGRGYEASGSLADYLGNALGAQGALAFQGQSQLNQNSLDARNAAMQQRNERDRNKTERRNGLFNFLGQGLGALGGAFMGGG